MHLLLFSGGSLKPSIPHVGSLLHTRCCLVVLPWWATWLSSVTFLLLSFAWLIHLGKTEPDRTLQRGNFNRPFLAKRVGWLLGAFLTRHSSLDYSHFGSASFISSCYYVFYYLPSCRSELFGLLGASRPISLLLVCHQCLCLGLPGPVVTPLAHFSIGADTVSFTGT